MYKTTKKSDHKMCVKSFNWCNCLKIYDLGTMSYKECIFLQMYSTSH